MLSFLQGDTEMSRRIKAHDWASSPIGEPRDWPQALKALVGVLLGSNQPMFVAWGPARTLIYNDCYAEILARKHPEALGQPFLEVWSEIQQDLIPIVDRAYAGAPVHMDDILLMMERKGYREETHFAFSYTPVRTEGGQIDGLFCACTEITEQVLATRALSESEARAHQVFDSVADYAIIVTDLDRRITSWNDGDPPSVWWTPMLAFRSWRGVSDECSTPELSGFFQARGR